MKRGRELYREGTPENIKKGYTDLVYGGDNVSVEKGVISAEGSGGGGGGGVFLTKNDGARIDDVYTQWFYDLSGQKLKTADLMSYYGSGVIITIPYESNNILHFLGFLNQVLDSYIEYVTISNGQITTQYLTDDGDGNFTPYGS